MTTNITQAQPAFHKTLLFGVRAHNVQSIVLTRSKVVAVAVVAAVVAAVPTRWGCKVQTKQTHLAEELAEVGVNVVTIHVQ